MIPAATWEAPGDEQYFEQRDRLESEHAVDQKRKGAGVPELRRGTRIRARSARLTA
jgi:hypothetical protein